MSQKEKGNRIEERVKLLAEKIITDAGYYLWDVIYEKEGAMWYLRILFDKPHDRRKSESGINSEECEAVSIPLNAIIDKQDFIDKIDILEIGSPGLTCKLRHPQHFIACIGLPVCAALRDDKGKTIYKKGLLDEYDEDKNEILIKDELLPVKNCIKINLDL